MENEGRKSRCVAEIVENFGGLLERENLESAGETLLRVLNCDSRQQLSQIGQVRFLTRVSLCITNSFALYSPRLWIEILAIIWLQDKVITQ